MKVLHGKYVKVTVLSILITLYALFVYANQEKEFKKNIPLTPDSIVSLQNVNGDITIESWDKNEINIYAKISASTAEALNNVEIKITQTGNQLDIRSKYSKEDKEQDFWSFIRNITRHIGHCCGGANVDYYVKVPVKTNLKSIESVNGDVIVKKVSGVVYSETVNGSIELSDLNSSIHAETVNGSITITVNALGDDIQCATVNGSIKVYLPNGTNAHLSAENINGSIKSDFPVTVREKIAHKELQGDIGQGGKNVQLETVNGSIYILKLGSKAEAE